MSHGTPPQGQGRPWQSPQGQPSNDALAMMRYDAAKKSVLVAYLFWFFIGYFGAHRFYLGRVGSGIVMLVIFLLSMLLTVVAIGFLGLLLIGLWWLVDAFLIPGMTARRNSRLIDELRG
jgi:TM2 domain-containing membrane protein YozV